MEHKVHGTEENHGTPNREVETFGRDNDLHIAPSKAAMKSIEIEKNRNITPKGQDSKQNKHWNCSTVIINSNE